MTIFDIFFMRIKMARKSCQLKFLKLTSLRLLWQMLRLVIKYFRVVGMRGLELLDVRQSIIYLIFRSINKSTLFHNSNTNKSTFLRETKTKEKDQLKFSFPHSDLIFKLYACTFNFFLIFFI